MTQQVYFFHGFVLLPLSFCTAREKSTTTCLCMQWQSHRTSQSSVAAWIVVLTLVCPSAAWSGMSWFCWRIFIWTFRLLHKHLWYRVCFLGVKNSPHVMQKAQVNLSSSSFFLQPQKTSSGSQDRPLQRTWSMSWPDLQESPQTFC